MDASVITTLVIVFIILIFVIGFAMFKRRSAAINRVINNPDVR